MQTFCELELPIFRVARGALRVGEENLFFAQKIHKWPKMLNFFLDLLQFNNHFLKVAWKILNVTISFLRRYMYFKMDENTLVSHLSEQN